MTRTTPKQDDGGAFTASASACDFIPETGMSPSHRVAVVEIQRRPAGSFIGSTVAIAALTLEEAEELRDQLSDIIIANGGET